MYYGRDYISYLDVAVHPEKYPNASKKPPYPARAEDVALIREYLDHEFGTQGLALGTLKTNANMLLEFSRETNGLPDITTKEIIATIARLRQKRGANTMIRLIATVKRFCLWMRSEKKNKRIDLAKIREIKPPASDTTRTAEKMLTADEITKIIEGAKSSRDRALLAMLYEGSARPIEICDAKWDEIKMDQYGASWNTSGKTGKPRYIRLIMAAPYLKAWRNDYPGEPSGSNYIFVSERKSRGKPYKFLTQSGLKVIVNRAVRESGLSKNVFPYLFRHSRITHNIADGIPDSIVKRQAWGHLKTNQLSTYAHLTDDDVDRVILSRAGIVTAPKEESGVRPLQCKFCGEINQRTARFCTECGRSLSEGAAATQDEILKSLQELAKRDPEKLVEALKKL